MCVCVRVVIALYWKARRNMSTTLMMMSSIMMRNTTTFWVSGGRLQRSMVLKNPILCLLHLPEPLPRAISPLASSSSSSSPPPPLPRSLSLSGKPPHHTAPPRPTLRLSPSLSSGAGLLFPSALTVASSASPATLPMHSVAPACQWRLGAYLCQRCVNLRTVELFVCYVRSIPPSSFTPFSSLRNRHLPCFSSMFQQYSFKFFILSFSQGVRMKDGGQDAAYLQFMLVPPVLFLPLLFIVGPLVFRLVLFSLHPTYAQSALHLKSPDHFFALCTSPCLPTFFAPAKMVLGVLPGAALPQLSI